MDPVDLVDSVDGKSCHDVEAFAAPIRTATVRERMGPELTTAPFQERHQTGVRRA